MLLEQGRFADAEREFRQSLAADVNDPVSHALLAICLVEQKKLAEATAEAEQAVALAPDLPLAHFVLGRSLLERNRLAEAAAAAQQAIALDPHDADYHGLLGFVRFQLRRWDDALASADQGLAVDPEHAGCLNLRAMALVKLGRRDEAARTIGGALEKDPENAHTHANQGWTLLHHGDAKAALHHFREALRLDPTLEWARAGVVEALKARNVVYRVMLRYFLWMQRLSSRAQWGIVLGAWFGYQVLGNVARTNPAAGRYLWPVLIAYVVFVVLTWLAYPLFNLMLRLHPVGRHALSREQRIGANLAGGLLAATVVAAGAWAWSGDVRFRELTMVTFLLMLPTAAIYNTPTGWPRSLQVVMAAGLALLGLGGAGLYFLVPDWTPDTRHVLIGLGNKFLGWFLWGVLISTFANAYLRSVRPQR